MKNRVLFFVTGFILLMPFIVSAQVTEAEKTLRDQKADTTLGWKSGGVLGLNMAQTSLTNWSAGGQNSFALNGIVSLFANHKGPKSSWVNSLDIGYGRIKQGELGYRKTDDKFDFLSKYGQKAFDNVYYAALINFKTQFSPGYKYTETDRQKISNAFAPAYLLGAIGLDYKPNAYFSTFAAPLTAKFTFVTDPELSATGAFGVDPGEKVNTEMGAYLRIIYTKNDFKNEFLKNISFTSKLDLFSNYLKNPQNIVVNWETLIVMKINKFISANLSTTLIYDDKIRIPFDRDGDDLLEPGESTGSKIQFKELLGIGLSFNL